MLKVSELNNQCQMLALSAECNAANFRAIESADLPELLLFYIDTDNPSREFLANLFSESTTYAWLIDGQPNTLAAVWYTFVANEASLIDISVVPSYRRKGLGRAILAQSLQKLINHGMKYCYLEVRRSNLGAKLLYEQFGFVEVGERLNYYRGQNGFEDAILMSLTIKN